MKSAQRSLCAAMLVLQAVVLFLTGVVLIGLSSVGTGAALGIGAGLAVACLGAAGLLRYRFGFWLGWAIQVLSVALGLVVTAMFLLGVLFGALWAGGYLLGAKIDRERAQRRVLEERWRAEHG